MTDPYFDAITIRLWGTGQDYTVHAEDNRIVSGRKNSEREYSEYWTFVRSVKVSGPARVEKSCPNCGADADVAQTGQCNHCSVKITGGEFDWVLSRIEQDETYTG